MELKLERDSIFGSTLDDVMRIQKVCIIASVETFCSDWSIKSYFLLQAKFPNAKIPVILSVLIESIRQLQGSVMFVVQKLGIAEVNSVAWHFVALVPKAFFA